MQNNGKLGKILLGIAGAGAGVLAYYVGRRAMSVASSTLKDTGANGLADLIPSEAQEMLASGSSRGNTGNKGGKARRANKKVRGGKKTSARA